MDSEIRSTVDAILPELVALRHELHAHPEIRFEEHWTSDRIAAFLDEVGVPYKRGYAKGTGIVADLEAPGDRRVLLRSDMDALEVQEATGVPYASQIPDRMHACGHDGHMTCLSGVIKTLAQHRDRLKGSVRFVFQPAEETEAGARYIVEEGVLDGVDAAFALHGWPGLPVGSVGLKSGPAMASADIFRVEIQGKGSHAADPAAGIDPIVVAAQMTTALTSIVSRQINPWDSAVVTVARITGGCATNIIPETATLEGTFRALSPAVRDTLAEAISRIATHTAEAFGATATVYFGEHHYPPLYNDPDTTAFVAATAARILGEENVKHLAHPTMAAEDFSFYLQRVPGTFLFLGNGEDSPGLHSPHYDFSDAAIRVAVRLMSALVADYLAEGEA